MEPKFDLHIEFPTQLGFTSQAETSVNASKSEYMSMFFTLWASPKCAFSAWLFMLLLLTLLPKTNYAQETEKTNPVCPTLLNHTFPRLQDEKTISMCNFSGKVLLVVNTASYCGYTAQYKELEKLHSQYKQQGFSVVGFPSNDFGKQEPKSNKEIADFCSNTFGVQFPMFAKTSVRTNSANSFYKQLIQASGQEPGWNFHKYLIDRQGKVIGSFKSGVSPLSQEITQRIDRALDAPPL